MNSLWKSPRSSTKTQAQKLAWAASRWQPQSASINLWLMHSCPGFTPRTNLLSTAHLARPSSSPKSYSPVPSSTSFCIRTSSCWIECTCRSKRLAIWRTHPQIKIACTLVSSQSLKAKRLRRLEHSRWLWKRIWTRLLGRIGRLRSKNKACRRKINANHLKLLYNAKTQKVH